MRGQPAACRLMQQLPIYKTATAAEQQQEQGSTPEQGQPPAPDQALAFVSLSGAAFLAPPGTPGGALPGSFLAAAGEAERGALQLLGVRALSLGDVLRYEGVLFSPLPFLSKKGSKLACTHQRRAFWAVPVMHCVSSFS